MSGFFWPWFFLALVFFKIEERLEKEAFSMPILSSCPSTSITEAAEALKQGQLVAFATETVYGLGADARNPEAIQKLYALKGRPTKHPVIVHLAEIQQIKTWAIKIPAMAWKLADAFWPGPLTMVLPRARHVLDEVTGGQETVALRVPAHPLAQELLKAFGDGLVAPSANRFGGISPTSAAHVREDFNPEELPWILDGGACTVGVESTIVAFEINGKPKVLRPGMITAEAIDTVWQDFQSVTTIEQSPRGFKDLNTEIIEATAIRAPGLLSKHYAPDTQLYLIPNFRLMPTIQARLSAMKALAEKRKAALADYSQKPVPTRFGVLARSAMPSELVSNSNQLHWVEASIDAKTYAQELYGHLHSLDELHLDVLLIEAVTETGEWAAIADRLKRAAAKG
jgi:L-threonylcarbamoyladenylate synthase